MLRPLPFLTAILLAAGLSVGLWAWLGRSVQIVDVPNGHIQCLSYSPATDGASPLEAKDGLFPVPEGRIARDMVMLAPYTDCIRTYSMLGAQGDGRVAYPKRSRVAEGVVENYGHFGAGRESEVHQTPAAKAPTTGVNLDHFGDDAFVEVGQRRGFARQILPQLRRMDVYVRRHGGREAMLVDAVADD